MRQYKDKPNMLSPYAIDGGALGTIICGVRNGVQNKVMTRFREDVKKRAATLVDYIRQTLDASMFHFTSDLYHYVHNGHVEGGKKLEKPLVVMLLEGRFTGDSISSKDEIECVVPVYLGNNPYRLARIKHEDTTIDDVVTSERAEEVINGTTENNAVKLMRSERYDEISNGMSEDQKADLKGRGYSKFEVDGSRFFYFNPKDLRDIEDVKGFYKEDGSLDLLDLVRYLTPIYDSVLIDEKLHKPKIPTQKDYRKRAPAHIVSRLKESLVTKILKRSCWKKTKENPEVMIVKYDALGKVIYEKGIIKDWTASRIVCKDVSEVNEYLEGLEPRSKIDDSGNQTITYKKIGAKNTTKIIVLYNKDKYIPKKGESSKREKKGKFKGMSISADVETKGFETIRREIQIVDRDQHWINEFNVGSMEDHKVLRRQQEQIPSEYRKFIDYFRPILENIFRVKKLEIELE